MYLFPALCVLTCCQGPIKLHNTLRSINTTYTSSEHSCLPWWPLDACSVRVPGSGIFHPGTAGFGQRDSPGARTRGIALVPSIISNGSAGRCFSICQGKTPDRHLALRRLHCRRVIQHRHSGIISVSAFISDVLGLLRVARSLM